MGKKMTLTDLFREANAGQIIGFELIQRYGENVKERTIAPIHKIKSKVIVLLRNGRESDLRFDYASLVEYDGNILKLYNAGLRELNEQENRVMNEWKNISSTEEYKKMAEIDVYTDSSNTYWKKKWFFEKSPCPYLFTSNGMNNKSYDYNTGKVRDPKVKGECILIYRVHKVQPTFDFSPSI